MSDARRDRQLIRYLTGELDAASARAVARRLAEDPEWARRYAALRATWGTLEPLANEPSAPGLARQILDRARREPRSELWAAVPLWLRAGAALALPLGLALGLGLSPDAAEPATAVEDAPWSSSLDGDTSDGLAAAYYELMVSSAEENGSSGVS